MEHRQHTTGGPPWFSVHPQAAIAVVFALFAGVTALRWLVDGTSEAVSMLYVLPVALAAVTFGRRAGAAAAAAGFVLFAVWAAAVGGIGLLGWGVRLLVLVLLGVLLGDATDRLRAREHDLAEAQALARLGAWRWAIGSDEVDLSPELAAVLGRHGEHRMPMADLSLPPDGPTPDLAALLAGLAPDESADVEAMEWRVGEEAHFLRLRAVRSGPIVHGVAQDITAEKRALALRVRLAEAEQRHQETGETNDSIAQGLSVAKWMLELGRTDDALEVLSHTIEVSQRLVSDLLGEGNLAPAVDGLAGGAAGE